MSKNIHLDKFYTPLETAQKCIEITQNILSDRFAITEWIEPSAGGGAFSSQIKNCIAYDIEPECPGIIQQDFLKLEISYKKGRVIIGNPPFGYSCNLARSFYKKGCNIADAIAFILPISQLNSSENFYDFDLIQSIDLGVLEYSGYRVHCCFNIYVRPAHGLLNKKKKTDSELFIIYDERQKNYAEIDHDICIFRRGSSVGKIKSVNTHTQTYKIKVYKEENVEYIRNKIIDFDWIGFRPHQSAPYIRKVDIYNLFNSEKKIKNNQLF